MGNISVAMLIGSYLKSQKKKCLALNNREKISIYISYNFFFINNFIFFSKS